MLLSACFNMAEGGSESLRNNLCKNQVKKQLDGKSIGDKEEQEEKPVNTTMTITTTTTTTTNNNTTTSPEEPENSVNGGNMSGFPDLPSDGFFNCLQRPTPVSVPKPVHTYSAPNTTDLKKMLEEAPSMSHGNSELSLGFSSHGGAASENARSTSKGSGSNPTLSPGPLKNTALQPQAGAGMTNPDQQAEDNSEASSVNSLSYCLVEACNSQTSTQGALSASTLPQPSPNHSSSPSPTPTNNLNGTMSDPQPSGMAHPMGFGAPPHVAGSGMYYPPPFVYFHPSFPHGMFPSVGEQVLYANPPMTQNISWPPLLNGYPAPTPLTATFTPPANHHSLDSRNIPGNVQGPSPPSSEENDREGSRSYSINPGVNTRLLRLRKPVLEWIRKKLERHCQNNWEALADLRGWKYDDIRAHLADCRHTRDSPFLTLLETAEFNCYTVEEFLQDMKLINRKDIVMDFMEVVKAH